PTGLAALPSTTLFRSDSGSLRVDACAASPNGEPHRMLALIQRVTRASVEVEGEVVGQTGPGLLALVGVQPGDGDATVARMAQRLDRKSTRLNSSHVKI